MSELADVRDLDCVASWSPLSFDMSEREVTGAAAVLRRILYRWASPAGTLRYAPRIGPARAVTDLAASTWSRDRKSTRLNSSHT